MDLRAHQRFLMAVWCMLQRTHVLQQRYNYQGLCHGWQQQKWLFLCPLSKWAPRACTPVTPAHYAAVLQEAFSLYSLDNGNSGFTEDIPERSNFPQTTCLGCIGF